MRSALPATAGLALLLGCNACNGGPDTPPPTVDIFKVDADQTLSTGGEGPCGIVVTDLNGDGSLDLAVSHIYTGSLSLLFNDGEGYFTNAGWNSPHLEPLQLEAELAVVAAGPLLSAGPDLAIAATSTDEVILLEHPGDLNAGPFIETRLPVGDTPYGATIGDFDLDGDHDLAVSNGESDSVFVFLSDGDALGTPTEVSVNGDEPGFVVLADVDGNSIPDLVTTNHSSSEVAVMAGLGGGEFATGVTHEVGGGPSSPELADIDGDGDLDLLTANEFSSDVSLLLNDGSGNFVPQQPLQVGNRPYYVDALDLDGDGDLDLVIPLDGEAKMAVLLGDGQGQFEQILSAHTGEEPGTAVHGDLNGDGALDVVITNFRSNSLSIFLNRRLLED